MSREYFMKRMVLLCVLAAMLVVIQSSAACVGRTVHLGITTATNERLMAELASMLIIERTGSTVQIDVYKDSTALYTAIKQGNVHVFFENTLRAAELVGK